MQYDPRQPYPSTTPTPTPITGNVTATSVGAGSPFGWTPTLTPEQQMTLLGGLSKLTYSAPAGGYLFNDEAQNANSYYNKFGAGGGGDPRANAFARSLYGVVGNAPTHPGMTAALQSLYQNTGLQPRQGPSFNERLGGMGPYAGPWGFGGYDPFAKVKALYR